MSKKKEETQTEKTVEDMLVETHSRFLETIREVYPLAVLGSLCIAISAFTQQSFPQAQVYALTGASMFLIAFVSSFATKIIPSWYFVVPSYFSTALGTLMLFLVTIEFSKTIPMVSQAMSGIPAMIFVVFMSSFCYALSRIVSKTKNRFIRLSLLISILFCIVFIAVSILIVAGAIFDVEILSQNSFENLAFPSFVVSLIFAFIAIPSINKERKKTKSLNEQKVTPLPSK